jgi:hypothetical protein
MSEALQGGQFTFPGTTLKVNRRAAHDPPDR